MRSRERKAKITGRACLNTISLKIGSPKGRVLVRDVQSEDLKTWQKRTKDLEYYLRVKNLRAKLQK